MWWYLFFFQAEDGIRDLVRSRGLGDVYKRQPQNAETLPAKAQALLTILSPAAASLPSTRSLGEACLLYTSDAADERSSVDLGGRRIIKKKTVRYLDVVRRHVLQRIAVR